MEETPWWRKKGLIPGGLLIAYGWISAVYQYFRDRESLDYFAMGYALRGAILHAVLFTLAGGAVIGWYYLKDRSSSQDR